MSPQPPPASIPLSIGLMLFDLARTIVAGERVDPVEVMRALADIAIQLLPVDQLKTFLDDAARKRDELAVDIAEDAKLKGG